MVFRWRDDQTLLFLETYKSHECLWNNKCEMYHNINTREKAYKTLLVEMNLPELTIADIKSKIKTIRTRYCSELDKIRKSEHSGAGTNDVYVPRLFWFKEADSFLRPVCTQKESSSNIKDILNKNLNKTDDFSQIDVDEETQGTDADEQTETPAYAENLTEAQTFTPHTVPLSTKYSKKRKSSNNIESLYGALHKLQKISEENRTRNNQEHEFDAFCKSLAIQLKKMPLQQALICQEKLQAVMTQQRLSNLLSDSNTRSSSPPFSINASSVATMPSPCTSSYYESENSCHTNNVEESNVESNILTQAIYELGEFN